MKDWNHVNTLLSVIHQASAAGPKFVKVAAMATDRLMKYFEEDTAHVIEPGTKIPLKAVTEDSHVIDPNLGAERLPERRI